MARVKISVEGFKDPKRRPRWIVWTLVVVILIAAVMIPVLGITSTRWFCSEGCHKVQDDTITAYQHSPHSEISCMACHMPVNANPVIFLLHKAEALGELAQTVTNNYELPLNAESEVALTMKSTQCTQCHTPNRVITPNEGIKIDHAVHTENGVQCTICHNRTAHVEDFAPVLINPKTKEPSRKHENFMEMTACFRCHTQEANKVETPGGQCFLCHPPKFDLLPASHKKPNFYPKGHGTLAVAEEKRAPWMNATATVDAEAPKLEGDERYAGENLPLVQDINVCSTCHSKSFCTDCHGVPMPHPKDFQKTHGTFGKANPQVCEKCHGQGVDFCNNCHHGQAIDYKYDPAIPWKQQHPTAVAKTGSAACLKCHNPTYCAVCHVTGKPPVATP